MMADAEKLLAELVLQVSDLTSEVIQLRSIVTGSPGFTEGWADPETAATALKNEGVIDAAHLKRLRLAGFFSEAKEEIYNKSRGKKRATWLYHVPNCRKALQRQRKVK